MSTTKILFSPFFREVGNPYRKVIKNYKQFVRFINENNGINDCFVSVYDLKYNIDKIFFDLDYLDIKTAWKFYNFVTEELGLSCIPVASGKKGFHFYVLFKPKRFRNHDEAIATIREVAFTIIDEGSFYNKTKNYKASIFDTRVIGDLRRMTRIPNTMRIECKTYCTYLPPNFGEFSYDDLFRHIKTVHDYNYEIKRKITIDEFETTDAYYEYVMTPIEPVDRVSSSKITNIDVNVDKLLKLALRPCIYNNLIVDEPAHEIRVMATVDLLHAEFSIDEIVEIYRKIGWVDFDERKTRYHVTELSRKVYGGRMKPYSCKKIRDLGYCLGGDCNW